MQVQDVHTTKPPAADSVVVMAGTLHVSSPATNTMGPPCLCAMLVFDPSRVQALTETDALLSAAGEAPHLAPWIASQSGLW